MQSKATTRLWSKKNAKLPRTPRGSARCQAHRLSTFLAELDACKALRQGWDGADAPRPTMIAILSAREFVLAALAANLPMERVAPSVIGGIGILFARDKAESYVEFYDNGTGYVLLANGRCNPKVLPILDESGRFPHTLAMIGAHLDT